MSKSFSNDLIHETSPYLLQHSHNPVNWKAWSDEALKQAKKENKLIIISIGYAACHWCHVMEHESFEDITVAEVMNSHFVNIKVDREERPDIDQVYMNAVQIMTGQGGWPLNAIALPDGRPVWGGTYVKKDDWIYILNQIAKLYKNDPEKLHEYADRLEQGMKNMDIVVLNPQQPDFTLDYIDDAIRNWQKSFDQKKGGFKRPPKFMLPNNFEFLLRYAHQTNNSDLLEFVNTTLTKMAYGGLFDQIGGGFSRYSVDVDWHVPHFEKMLYDNAQLVSLYSHAYALTKNELYMEVVYETIEFIEKELCLEDGIFYSSLDADSLNDYGELEEGAYYTWDEKTLRDILKEDFLMFSSYYNINNYGHWEHDKYVLIRNISDEEFIKAHQISLDDFKNKKNRWKSLLQEEIKKRAKPRLDDKTLTEWNALMLKGYIDAYKTFGKESFLKIALKNANFILKQQLSPEGGLYRNYKNGKSTINAFLIDYAATIEAYIDLYQVTAEENWLNTARNLTNYVFDNFFDEQSGMFFYTSKQDNPLVVRNIEYRDNVIPSSNSIMAKNLFKLSHYFSNSIYLKTATTMLNNIKPEILSYPSGFSNWLDLMLNYTNPFFEVAIVGKDALEKVEEFSNQYLPNILIAICNVPSNLPLVRDRFIEKKTNIYVCVNNSCQLPTESISEAMELINSK